MVANNNKLPQLLKIQASQKINDNLRGGILTTHHKNLISLIKKEPKTLIRKRLTIQQKNGQEPQKQAVNLKRKYKSIYTYKNTPNLTF